jgi:hypothetical protein
MPTAAAFLDPAMLMVIAEIEARRRRDTLANFSVATRTTLAHAGSLPRRAATKNLVLREWRRL